FPVGSQERSGPLVRGLVRAPGELDLSADELGAVGLAVIVEPVGEDEARSVLVGMVGDVGQEGLFGSHGGLGGQMARPLLPDDSLTGRTGSFYTAAAPRRGPRTLSRKRKKGAACLPLAA